MKWVVKIHPLVFKEDFKHIDRQGQQLIIKAIRKKLAVAPYQYGKPLGDGLAGYWRLRVGKYRAVYKIKKAKIEVFVIKIGLRRNAEVYKKIFNRLAKIG